MFTNLFQNLGLGELCQDKGAWVCQDTAPPKDKSKADEASAQALDIEAGGDGVATQGSSSIGDGRKGGKDDGESTKIVYWRNLADRTVKSHIFLYAEPASETQLGNLIQASKVIPEKLLPGQYIGVFFDPKACCEVATQPATRLAPLRDDKGTKLIHGAIRGLNRGQPEDIATLEAGCLYHLLDGYKQGHCCLHAACPSVSVCLFVAHVSAHPCGSLPWTCVLAASGTMTMRKLATGWTTSRTMM